MDSLPYELLDAIVDRIHYPEDLLQIRMLNKTFCALATPRVFQKIVVKKSFTSATKFGEILQNDAIAQVIEAITFSESYDYRSLMGVTEPKPKSNEEVLLKPLASSFARIHDLSRLKALHLSFCGSHFTPNPLLLQSTILSAILSRPPLLSLSSLSIHNLTTLNEPIYDLPSFTGLFGSLSSLSIVTDSNGDSKSHSRDAYIRFWEQGIQHHVLGSHTHTLTSFTLHSDLDVGIVPRLDLSQANFPALESLSLRRILFNAVTHVEEFILRHKGTLRKLSLTQCRIAIEDPAQGAPRQWSHIWDCFAEELKALEMLKVESELNWLEDYADSDYDVEEPMNYVRPKEGLQGTRYAYSTMQKSPYDVGDAQALQEFRCLIHLEDEY